ncbi:MAG: HAD family phosphatase [Gemmatimonadetes bacterium]|nr:HAD family phosphatase [Gemmatimonadota bacterium]
MHRAAAQERSNAVLPRASGLVMDLDGTLIDAGERISPGVEAAVRAAASLVPVAIVSGREPGDVVRFARAVGLEGAQVSDNGARIVDPRAGRTLCEAPMHPAVARRIVSDLERRGLRFFAVDAGRMARSRAEITVWRVTIIAAHAVTQRAADEVAGAYRGVPGVCVVPSLSADAAMAYVNFTRTGVNKGTGVVRLARMVGVDPARLTAVGDSHNDVDMFAVVGTPVAMGNAPEEVKRAAGRVVAPVSADGLAEAIRRFVLPSGDGAP